MHFACFRCGSKDRGSTQNVQEIEAKASQLILDIERVILQAIAQPLGTAPLVEVVKTGDKMVIIVSDV